MQLRERPSPEEEFGKAVVYWRELAGLSQRALSAKLAESGTTIDPTALSRLEQGKRAVRLNEALAIADALDVELEFLLSRNRTPDAELRTLRRSANSAMLALREPLLEFMNGILWVHQHLQEHPNLIEMMDDPDVGRLESIDDYFGWVTRNIQMVEFHARHQGWRAEDDYVQVSDLIEQEEILDLVRSFAATLVDHIDKPMDAAEAIRARAAELQMDELLPGPFLIIHRPGEENERGEHPETPER